MRVRHLGLRGAFIVLATMNASVLGAQKKQGYTYDIIITTRMAGAMMAASPNMDSTPHRSRVTAAGTMARMESERGLGEGPMAISPGDYMVIDGKQMRMVSPTTKTVTVMAPETMMGGVNDMFKDMPVAMTLSDVKVTTDSLGPGETLLGMPTERWRTTTSFTIKIDAGGMGQSMTMSQRQETESWITRKMPPLFTPMAQSPPVTDTTMNTGPFGDLMVKMMRAMERLPRGFHVREVMTMNMNSPAGMDMTSSMTSDVANLKATLIDPSMFVVPAGYKVVDFGDKMRQMMDSMKAAAQARRP